MKSAFRILLGALSAAVALSASVPTVGDAPRLITNLPGWSDYSFKQYSGYVTVNPMHGRALFYWFTESKSNPSSDPLVIWLNGGPGCSSIGGGLMSELGPFFPEGDGTLKANPYAWNKIANIIFVESPAGVGFSYSNTTSDYYVGDARTSEDLYTFLQGFLDKFPSYRSNPVYIAGESYGGHYVPNFAHTIVQKNQAGYNPKINFHGFMVGNAWTVAEIDNTGAAFDWWSHGLIYDDAFFGILKHCNMSNIGPLKNAQLRGAYATLQEMESSGTSFAAGDCTFYTNLAWQQMGNIDIYDIYTDVCPTGENAQSRHANHFLKQLGRKHKETSKTSLGKPGFGLRGDRHLSGSNNAAGAAKNYDPCIDQKVYNYLNRADVQAAIGARHLGYPWLDCSNIVHYSRKSLLSSMLPVYRDLFKAGIKIMVYSGDVDGIVPITGTRAWLDQLNLPVKTPWRSYTVDGQVGGYTLEYDQLTFTSVRNAGHMVPYTQQSRGFHIFQQFLRGQPM